MSGPAKPPPYQLRELIAEILGTMERFGFDPSDPLHPLIRSLLTLALVADRLAKGLTRETRRLEEMVRVDLRTLVLEFALCLVGVVLGALLLGCMGGYLLGDRRVFGSSLSAEEQVRQALGTDAASARIWKRYAEWNDPRAAAASCAEQPPRYENGRRVCYLRLVAEPQPRSEAQ